MTQSKFWEEFNKRMALKLSMITREWIDDDTCVEVLDFVVGEEVVNVQLIKEDGDVDEVVLYFKSGRRLYIYHDYDCCENVTLIDVIGGNIDDLVGQKIVSIKSVSKQTDDKMIDRENVHMDESNTWTFVTIFTMRDDITLRWHGGSNGYYSESVDFDYYDENNNRIY